jgi:hypothetical protein
MKQYINYNKKVMATFAEYGDPDVAIDLTDTLTLCSPTHRGTNSALNTPCSAV